MTSPRPWRFVALADRPELGIRAGDIITHTAGRPMRITRTMFGNSGLLLVLLDEGAIEQVDDFVGRDRAIVEAMEAADEPSPAPTSFLRLLRSDDPAS